MRIHGILFITTIIISINIYPQQNSLKILTLNVWSGLDYRGTFKFGEYESDARRERRFETFMSQIKEFVPDVIFLQEANPSGNYASRVAKELDYDEIHHVCNAGIKLGPIGIPINSKEGIVILSKKELQLEEIDVVKLAGSLGVYGDLISLHFDESIFALVGKIKINNTPVYLVNVHLSAEPAFDSSQVGNRISQVIKLMKYLSKFEEYPIILGGDFNATPESKEIKLITKEIKYFDTFKKNSSENVFTWDPLVNTNTNFSTSYFDACGKRLSEKEMKSADYDKVPRRIDYIFLNNKFLHDDVLNTKIIFNSPIDDVFVSDHFGVVTTINLDNAIQISPKEFNTIQQTHENTLEPLPILSYDSDSGFGYGIKAFILNCLNLNESFDMVLFNSTKGEKWYRFVFSIPDFELRQGKIYPLAVDLIIDYDKWIKNSFFGIGNYSKFENRQFYAREPFEISLLANRGFSEQFIGQFGIKYKVIKNYNFNRSNNPNSINSLSPELIPSTSKNLSLTTNLRYDTRNSFINPSRGIVLQVEGEFSPKFDFTNSNFTRLGITLQSYSKLFYPTTILAVRFNYQNLQGNSIPLQNLLSLGGNQTLRGYPQDRFLDRILALGNAEIRFPIIWRFGGVAGIDLGRVWNKSADFGFKDWHLNSNFGLRFYFETFIVRLDVGLSDETTGFYLNFGQIF